MLSEALAAASGADPALDRRLADELKAPPADYSASVDAAIGLVRHALPGWGWHVGWHADGVTPYASLHDPARTVHVEAKGPSVQLALLRAMGQALETAAAKPSD
jgi:hypothetical protein